MQSFTMCLGQVIVNSLCLGFVAGANLNSFDPHPTPLAWVVAIFNSLAITINVWCLIRLT